MTDTNTNLKIAYNFKDAERTLKLWFLKCFGFNTDFEFVSKESLVLSSGSFIYFQNKVYVSFLDEEFNNFIFCHKIDSEESIIGFVRFDENKTSHLFSSFNGRTEFDLKSFKFSLYNLNLEAPNSTHNNFFEQKPFGILSDSQKNGISQAYDLFLEFEK